MSTFKFVSNENVRVITFDSSPKGTFEKAYGWDPDKVEVKYSKNQLETEVYDVMVANVKMGELYYRSPTWPGGQSR